MGVNQMNGSSDGSGNTTLGRDSNFDSGDTSVHDPAAASPV
jgi:hypothetical protein